MATRSIGLDEQPVPAAGWLRRLWATAYLAGRLRDARRAAFAPPALLRARQTRRVRAMVRHAARTVPYYRETFRRLGLRPEDFRGVEDLARLPIIEPEALSEDPLRFVSAAYPLDACVRLCTGGSTGKPRVVYHSLEGILQNAAQGERDRAPIVARLGRRLGYRETVIISPRSTAQSLQEFLRRHALVPARCDIQRQYLSLLDRPEDNVPRINAFRPDVIHSYGSYLAMLFGYLADHEPPFHRPRVVTYSSDSLDDSVRRLITESFGIPVFGAYQANEAFKLGFECECHTGLHMNVDLYPIRVIDRAGADAAVGETGEVVLSNLVNRATVLLNYRLGDLAARLPGPCRCGRALPLLSFPPGRSDDWIVRSSGGFIHPQAVRSVFGALAGVRQYQVVQTEPSRFQVKLVVAPAADRSALNSIVADLFRDRIGPEVRVDLEFVPRIDRGPNGKFRPVLSLCRCDR